MVRLISVLAVTLAALAFVAPSADAGGRGHGGEITAVYADRGAFDLTRGDKTVTVVTSDRTRFVVNGQRATFDDLEVGMHARVRGRYDREKGVFNARIVQARHAR